MQNKVIAIGFEGTSNHYGETKKHELECKFMLVPNEIGSISYMVRKMTPNNRP